VEERESIAIAMMDARTLVQNNHKRQNTGMGSSSSCQEIDDDELGVFQLFLTRALIPNTRILEFRQRYLIKLIKVNQAIHTLE